jgi:hypothetical protein
VGVRHRSSFASLAAAATLLLLVAAGGWYKRRYSAFYVSEAQMNRKVEYFDPIDEQLEDGGYEALMYKKFTILNHLQSHTVRPPSTVHAI